MIIPTRRPDLELINKKGEKKKEDRKKRELSSSRFCRSGRPQNENKKKAKNIQILQPG